jgi:hypothetical protein
MTINAIETLLVFLCIFGTVGAARGPHQELITLVGIAMTLALLNFGGTDIVQHLPTRLLAGVASLLNNQSGSDYLSQHPWPDPWPTIMLWVGTIGLVALSYFMGTRFGQSKGETANRDFGSVAMGFLIGALNGVFICVFLFSQGGLQANVSIQFPDSNLTRGTIAPLILLGVVLTIIAIAVTSKHEKTT